MGTTGAMGMADEVNRGNVQLVVALDWHLTSNHYRPLPHTMIPIAVWAIEQANEGNWEGTHTMPRGIQFRYCDEITVEEAVESMHLESFLAYEDQE